MVPGDAVSRAGVEVLSTSAEADLLVEHLFRTEGRSLVRLARLFTDDRNAAEDLVQEAFIRFHRSVGRLRDIDAAPAYLRSIVLNLARDHNRRGLLSRRHREIRPVDRHEEVLEAAIDRIEASRDGRIVLAAVRDLPRRQRDCLVLRFVSGLSEYEVAENLGISRNTVKTHVRRALETLRSTTGGDRDGS